MNEMIQAWPMVKEEPRLRVRIVSPDWVVRGAVARLVERLAPAARIEQADVVDTNARPGFSSEPMVLVIHVRADTRQIASQLYTGLVVLLLDDDAQTVEAGAAAQVVRQWRDEPTLVRAALEQAIEHSTALAGANTRPARPTGLTPRQMDVLKRLAEGRSNADIGKDLGMSENTVRIHVSAILRTLGLANRTQAALWAAQANRPLAASTGHGLGAGGY